MRAGVAAKPRANLKTEPVIEQELEGLPEPAARYLRSAIPADSSLPAGVRLSMEGTIRIGAKWLPFTAHQTLEPLSRFRWQAEVRHRWMRITGHDFYEGGRGEMDWRAWGFLPILKASGPDIARSARGRCAGEAIYAPSALLPRHGVAWRQVSERIVAASLPIDGAIEELFLEVDQAGRLWSAWLSRWGNPDSDKQWRLQPFGVVIEEMGEFNGYRIPSQVRAGWWFGEDRFEKGEFFRARILSADYF